MLSHPQLLKEVDESDNRLLTCTEYLVCPWLFFIEEEALKRLLIGHSRSLDGFIPDCSSGLNCTIPSTSTGYNQISHPAYLSGQLPVGRTTIKSIQAGVVLEELVSAL